MTDVRGVRRAAVCAATAGVLALVACARSADGGGGCPAGFYDANGDPADGCEYACTPGPNAPSDPIDPQLVDENCDGTDGVVAKLLFVASDGIDAPNAGSRTAPMKTIAYAMRAAQEQGKDL